MPSIIYDYKTNWKWRVRNANDKGEIEEEDFDTREEAQAKVDKICQSRIKRMEVLGKIAKNNKS